jgi:hypothetical protein
MAKFGTAPALALALVVAATGIWEGNSAWGQGPVRKLDLPRILDRIADQAEAFRRVAPSVLAEETLEQRVKLSPDNPNFITHEIVSEYGYGGTPEAPNAIHEIRKVISSDGKQVTTTAKARQAMTLGLHSADDKLKKRLLEDFEKHGLRGAVTDFGQVILLFSARHRKDYEFELAGQKLIGTDQVTVLDYKQVGGSSGVTMFRGNAEDKQPLQGQILVRKTDGMPMRITMSSTASTADGPLKDELSVDYEESSLGCILPSTVVHRESFHDVVVSENTFRYGPFRQMEDGRKLQIPESVKPK